MFSWRAIRFLVFGLLFSGSAFVTSYFFVNPELTPKLYFAEIAALVCCIWMAVASVRERFCIVFTRTDLWVVAGLLYVCLRFFAGGAFYLNLVLPFFCFSFLYYCWHHAPVENRWVGYILGFIALAETLFGLWPLIQSVHQGTGLPDMRGSFDNPAGFAACLTGLFPWCLYNVRSSLKGKKVFWIIVAVLVLAGVVASGSRVGMLCILGVSVWTLYPFKRKMAVLGMVLVLALGVLYFFRVDSANGRLLIWRCSFGLMRDHLLVGAGPNGFQANYMLYQAEYFKANPNSGLSVLADNVLHPFNEYVAVVSGYGLAGLLILGLIGGSVFRACRISFGEEKRTALLCVMSVLLFSGFSYPFRYSFVWILVAYSVSILVQGEKPVFSVSGGPKNIFLALFVLLCLFFVFFCGRRMKAEMDWNTVAHQGVLTYPEEKLPEYERIYGVLGEDPQFLYNYASELFRVARFDQSLIMVRKCSGGLNDVDVQMLLARNYAALGKVDSAQHSFLLASQMCPNRFAPWIGLMRLYAATNRMEEAEKMARKVLSKEIKVPSEPVLLMIDEARRFVELRNGI